MIVLYVMVEVPRFFSLMLFVSNMSNFPIFTLPKCQMPALGIHLLAIRRSTGCPVGRVGEEIEPQANFYKWNEQVN